MKITQIINKKTTIPTLLNVCAVDGYIHATNTHCYVKAPTTLQNGLYNYKEYDAGIFNPKEGAEDYPIKTALEWTNTVVLDADAREFQDALKFCSLAISNEETRYYLNGIYFNIEAGELVAVDGFKLLKTNLRGVEGLLNHNLKTHGQGKGFILHKDVVKLILSGKIEGQVIISYCLENKTEWVRFIFAGDVEIITKVIDGTFPDYKRATPNITNPQSIINLNKKSWETAYKQAKKAGKLKVIRFSSKGFEYDAGVYLPYPSNIPEGAAFCSAYIADMFKAFGSDIELQADDIATPYLIKDNAGRVGVLMPMRNL